MRESDKNKQVSSSLPGVQDPRKGNRGDYTPETQSVVKHTHTNTETQTHRHKQRRERATMIKDREHRRTGAP